MKIYQQNEKKNSYFHVYDNSLKLFAIRVGGKLDKNESFMTDSKTLK